MTATRTLRGRAAHIAFGILIVLTVGLAPRAVGSAQAASPVLNWHALGNLTYDLPAAPGGKVKLVNGAYSAPIAEGSATKFEVQLAPVAMMGDMTGGGLPDAAVVLVSKSGGSGTFYDLTVVLNINGALKPVRPVHLGDRIAARPSSRTTIAWGPGFRKVTPASVNATQRTVALPGICAGGCSLPTVARSGPGGLGRIA
jgi:hypothetical protein